MRKKGIIFLLVLLAIILGLSLFFTDMWLEGEMESIGSDIVGAKVEFDGVDFSFLELRIKWDRLQVTDPNDTWQNLFETGKTAFDMQLEPLLENKYIVENLQLEGLQFSTKRETNGALPRKKQKKSRLAKVIETEIEKQMEQLPVLNLGQYTKKVNVDSIWKMVNLQSPHKIDTLRTQIQQQYSRWETRLNELPTEKELKAYEDQIESIQIENIKTIDELQNTLKKTNRIYKEADSLLKNFKQVKTEFQQDMKQIQQLPDQVKSWVQNDYQRVLNLAKIPEISTGNVAQVLFGRRILNQLDQATGYIGTARYYAEQVKSGQPKKESPPRLKGQDIYFSAKQGWPKYWFKRISLSGRILNGMQVSGIVSDIVSNQSIIDQPTTVELSGERRDQTALKLTGTLDYREEKPSEKFTLNISRMPLQDVKLTDFPLMPKKIMIGNGELGAELNFSGSDFYSKIDFAASNLKFELSAPPANMNSRLVEISRSLAQSINKITFEAVARETGGKFSLSLNSNLDNLIYEKVKAILSGEIRKAREELEERVRMEVEKYRDQLESLMAQKEQELRAKMESVEKEIQKQKAAIEAKRKEIENRIEEEKKKLQNKLGDEAKKKLKDLLK